ncbi:MAG: sulfotransferase [Bacteroidia bacterium]|nr:sulfotransferase [Bacteroidia bacterium]
MKSPIFIFSMPRSGSTLLQRLMMQHSEIASVSEPWLLLPLLYAKKEQGMITEYSHLNGHKALNDLILKLPNGEKGYLDGVRKMSDQIYSQLCNKGEKYFLDKTPRYHLIIEDIIKLYPNGKFIFLVRNPLDIYASILTTWGNNRFKRLFAVSIDLEEGWHNIANGFKAINENSMIIKYEELVENSDRILKDVCAYLDIKFEKQNELASLDGRLGDQTGSRQFSKVSNESLEKWKSVFDSTYRKKVLSQYISGINPEDFAVFGLDKSNILNQIKAHKVKKWFSFRDWLDIRFYKWATNLNGHLYFSSVFKWTKKKFLS